MKKKVKLITTIASLCLAVALMAFGVYAATSATLGITSQVSFTASGVTVQFDVEVEYDAAYVDYTDTDATKIEGTYTAYTEQAKKNSWTSGVIDPLAGTAAYDWNLGSYAFKEVANVAGKTVVYKFKITNKGSNPVAITVTTGVEPVESGEAGTIAVTTDGTAANLAKNAVYTYTVTVTLNDATMDWAAKSISPAFSVAKKA